MWIYCRLVYMPFSYLYGKRFVGPITPLILQLREELYTQPYNEIKWMEVRHLCAKVSLPNFLHMHDTCAFAYRLLIISSYALVLQNYSYRRISTFPILGYKIYFGIVYTY